MKEYIAETGGRYTYSDDILNLQELALSFTSIFDGCSNFIISGCEIVNSDITPGFVWINGKVRRFEGQLNTSFPYYIYEANGSETTTYANEMSKRGRINYLCTGSTIIPTNTDPITNTVPGYIEMTEAYSPRFIDKFFGKYSVLLDTPFNKQTIKKDLITTGKLTGEKDIESKTAIIASNPQTGYTLRNIIKSDGNASIGVYFNGLLVNEIVIDVNGNFYFVRNKKIIATMNEKGIVYEEAQSNIVQSGSIKIFQDHIINNVDASDTGAIHINYTGYNDITHFRDFNVYGGKKGTAILKVTGAKNSVDINGLFSVLKDDEALIIRNKKHKQTNQFLQNWISYQDVDGITTAKLGYLDNDSFNFTIENNLGDIHLKSAHVNVTGVLRVNGTSIADIYVTQISHTGDLDKKVDKVTGKQLSDENFTKIYKDKLDSISQGNIGGSSDGFVTATDVSKELNKRTEKDKNLSDLTDKDKARDNIGAEKKGEAALKLAKASNLNDLENKVTARTNLSVYSKSEINTLLANKLNSTDAYSGEIFTTTLKNKLDGIRTGVISSTGVLTIDGFISGSTLITQLNKKANRLMTGYTAEEKATIATNIAVYSKTDGDARYGKLTSYFSDYLTKLQTAGYSLDNAKLYLRNKIDAAGKTDLNNYVSKTGKLSDLTLADETAKRTACRNLGAAYETDCQTKLYDSGWVQVLNYGSGTDTRNLYVRQIGSLVYIQGVLNTRRREGSNQGGVVGYIPGVITPPRFGVCFFLTHASDSEKKNNGAMFKIYGGAREIRIWESSYVVDTEVCFSYMT